MYTGQMIHHFANTEMLLTNWSLRDQRGSKAMNQLINLRTHPAGLNHSRISQLKQIKSRLHFRSLIIFTLVYIFLVIVVSVSALYICFCHYHRLVCTFFSSFPLAYGLCFINFCHYRRRRCFHTFTSLLLFIANKTIKTAKNKTKSFSYEK